MALELDDPASFDYGTAPLELVGRMTAVKNAIGDVSDLDDAVLGTRLLIPDFEVVHQKYHSQFVLYGVPEHVAAQHDCSNYIQVGRHRERKPKEARGFKYFATTFYLDAPAGRSETLGVLWTKEEGYWKIISYEVEPTAHSATSTRANVGPPSGDAGASA